MTTGNLTDVCTPDFTAASSTKPKGRSSVSVHQGTNTQNNAQEGTSSTCHDTGDCENSRRTETSRMHKDKQAQREQWSRGRGRGCGAAVWWAQGVWGGGWKGSGDGRCDDWIHNMSVLNVTELWDLQRLRYWILLCQFRHDKRYKKIRFDEKEIRKHDELLKTEVQKTY